jgi:hypothetical protein
LAGLFALEQKNGYLLGVRCVDRVELDACDRG